MYNLLKGKVGIISGALDENSIAWKIAETAHAEGAKFVLTNAPVALRMGTIQQLAEKCETIVIPADATSIEDWENLYTKATEHLGGKLDFALHSIGMSPNVRKKKDYGDLNHAWTLQAIDISGLSFHKMLQVAEKMDILNEEASVVALSYIAAQRTFPDYSDMAHAKAVLESIARSYGYRLGRSKKVRINTVSQSPTATTAGTGVGGFDAFMNYAEKMSPLGNASAQECADFVISLFSDFTKKVTMQNLYHDGGFSAMGVSEEVMEMFGEEK
ncbi:enoyl-ACP reductase [Bernardetia sp.]|uniref:enoyl-ACP reductase FabI n=1 Tax=Bernardetia sp. TaxID=1937974 RepID=UPI0025B9EB32|nr:SDR family oxidoreductase [Bernardetia sp.]